MKSIIKTISVDAILNVQVAKYDSNSSKLFKIRMLLKAFCLILFFILNNCMAGLAQYTVTQPFSATTIPTGWTSTIGSGSYNWAFEASGTSPTCSPHSTPDMAWFNSFSATSGSYASLFTPVINFAGRNSVATTVTMWWYRDVSNYNNTTYAAEGVTVYVNTSASLTGATSMGFVPRAGAVATSGGVSGTSTTSTSGWYQYTFTVPTTFNSATNYIIFKAYSNYGDNCFMDDIVYTVYPLVVSPTSLSFSNTCVGSSSATQNIAISAANSLLPASGNITVTAPSGFLVYNGSAWVSSYTIAYTGSALSATTVPVQFTPVATGLASGNVTFTTTGGVSASVAVSGTGLAQPTAVTASGGGTYCGSATITASNGGSGTIYFQGTTSNGTSTATPSASQVISASGTYYFRAQSASGCWGTQGSVTVTINPLPAAVIVSGAGAFCNNETLTASGGTGGTIYFQGTTSGGTSTATPSSSQVVTSSGTYYFNSETSLGCWGTQGSAAVTINANPSVITGANSVCQGFSTTLNDVTTGGAWSSNNSNATVGSSSGSVTGVSAGSSIISYILSTGCYAIAAMTINPQPVAMSGPGNVCIGLTTNYSDGTTGGSWSISNSNATIGSSSGVVTGAVSGTSVVTYTLPAGCLVTSPLAVNASPLPITGTLNACIGNSVTINDATGGGTWASSNPAIASIGSSSGTVTAGSSAGTVTITYTAAGCYVTSTFIVNGSPAAITGTTTVCTGLSTTLSNPGGVGLWTSSNTAVATVGSNTGIVTSINAGTTLISYSNGCGTPATTIVTVNQTPLAITGLSQLCTGAGSATLTDATSGGTWSSSNTSVVSAGSSTGNISPVAVGTAIITYDLGNGCVPSTYGETVYSPPGAITGSSVICNGSSATLSNPTAGGTWSSSNPGIASVGIGTGLVTAVSQGTAIIVYANGCGTPASQTVTINSAPSIITGTNLLCTGGTTTLSNTSSNGTWSSSATGVATIGSVSGLVTGVGQGTTTINYSNGCGSAATVVVTVNTTPSTISGSANLCAGSTTTLSNTSINGTWSSGSTVIATVGSLTGLVTGASQGSDIIFYSTGCGSPATFTLSVTGLPSSITGIPVACVGTNTTLSNASAGGTWTSSNTAIATIGSSTGIATGVALGTSIISYSTGCGTAASTLITITTAGTAPTVSPTSGTICNGGSVTLTGSVLANLFPNESWENGVPTTVGTAVDGWNILGPNNSYVSQVTTGTYPTVSAPESGTYFMEWNSFNAASGDNATIYSPSFSMSGVGSATLTFWFYRDYASSYTGTTFASEGFTVYVNTSASTTGATSLGYVPRDAQTAVTGSYISGTSTTTTSGWYQYTCTIPSSYTGSTNYILFYMYSVYGDNCYMDNVTLTGTEYPTWTPFTNLYTNSGFTTAYTGTALSPVYVHPTTITSTNTINYAASVGCSSTTASITINPTPAAITGTTSVCTGSTTTLSDPTVSGTWISSNTSVATVGSSTGIVSGVSAGTSIISYVLTTGCGTATATVTVNATPAAVTGASSVCSGQTIALNDVTTGGNWSSSSTGTASVGSTGIVTGVSAGPVNISYTMASGCSSIEAITVNAVPAAISGTTSVCALIASTLYDATSSGTWTSSNTSVATAGSSTGLINGLIPGTAIITYALATGCNSTVPFTVNGSPAAISGTFGICTSGTTTLTDVTTGGAWSSNNPAVASIGSSSGFVTGGTVAGTATISYSVLGCPAIVSFIVNGSPAAITGPTSVCTGNTISLSDPGGVGNWTSSNIVAATVGSLSGIVSGVTSGSTIISYSNGCGTPANITITVNQSPGTISGVTLSCIGTPVTISNTVTGGSWTSSNTAVATIGSSSGLLTPLTYGTVVLTYSMGNGCSVATYNETVYAVPSSITGTINLCNSSFTTLSNSSAGGSWTSSNIGVATIGSNNGFVSSISQGTTLINYSNGCGTAASATLTVNNTPSGISGATSVCPGSNITLTNTATNGVWTSSNTAVATIGSNTGIVSGVSTGTTIITYSNSCGSAATITITVYTNSAITGTMYTAVGSTRTLSDATSGGAWSSSNTAVATVVSTTGVVTGVAAGTVTISYTTGCGSVVSLFNVIAASGCSPLPTCADASSVCGYYMYVASTGYPFTLTGALGTSINDAVSCNAAAYVNGVTSNIADMYQGLSYSSHFGYNASGYAMSCQLWIDFNNNGTFETSESVGGGSWSTTTGTTQSITVPYSAPAGTYRMRVISDYVGGGCGSTGYPCYPNLTPCPTTATYYYEETRDYAATILCNAGPITGSTSVCAGLTSTLSDASTGTWSSANPLVATVGSATGIVSGVSLGTAIITFNTVCGAYSTTTVTVSTPAGITGVTNVCPGATTNLSDASGAGTWLSGSTATATVGAGTGTVTGVMAGTAIITFTLTSTGCSSTAVVTVNPLPSAIGGYPVICAGLTTTLSDSISGGTWSAGNSDATVGPSTGIVTGVTAGTTVISYILPTGCYSTVAVTINPLPSAISGAASVCTGFTATLSDAGGGTWVSGNTAVATINSSGLVSGLTSGTSKITYTLSTGCIANITVTVNASPAVITGIFSACTGNSTTLSDITTGGTWSSSLPGIASIGSSTGFLTAGTGAGTCTITYTAAGCPAYTTFVVSGSPGTITGLSSVCMGATIALSDPGGVGFWSGSNNSIATAGSSSGIITGVSAGTVTITYSNGCGTPATATVTVLQTPSAITGTGTTCNSGTVTLSDVNTGGTWGSSNTAVATIGSSSGILTPLTQGTSVITYSLNNGCVNAVSTEVVIIPAGTITGITSLCSGNTTTLGDASVSGTWSSGSTAIATAGSSTGIITGVSQGTVTITYYTGCGSAATITVSVNATPGTITGVTSVCAGTNSALSNSSTGGTWSSSNTSIATIGSLTGLVTGVALGTCTINYNNGCGSPAATTLTVITSIGTPTVTPTSSTMCNGGSLTLTGSAIVNLLPVESWENGVPTAIGTPVDGWNLATGSTTGYLSQVTSGTYPTVSAAESGAYFLEWNSYNAPSGDFATVYSPSFNMTGVTGATLTFWFYRDYGSSYTGTTYAAEGFTVYANTTNSTTGATTLGFVPRDAQTAVTGSYISGTSTTLTSGWYQYTCTIPSTFTGSTNYILFYMYSVYGDNCFMDNVALTGTMYPTWSPTTNLFANSGLTTAYTGAAQNNVYVHPTTTTTTTAYTYSAGVGCASVTSTVTVNPNPAAITGTPVVCAGLTNNLSDVTPSGTWVSSNTGIATVGSGTGIVTGVAAGTASISYTLTTGCGTAIAIETVNALPTVVTVTGGGTYCGISPVINASNGGSGTIYFQGTTSNGTSTATPSTSQTISSSGTYYFRALSASGCWGNQGSAVITINPVPSLTSANNDGPICAGTIIDFSVTGATNVTGYAWSGPVAVSGSTSSSATIPSATTSAAGVYTVNVNNGVGTGCTVPYYTTVVVSPDPTISSANNDGPICVGSTIDLSVTGASNVTGYLWSGPVAITGANTAAASIPSATTAASGSYTLTVNNGTGRGCTANYYTTAIVSPFPSLSSANNSGPVCPGGTLNLSVSGASNVTGYLWTGPVSITGATSPSASVPSVTTAAAGTFTVSINNGAGRGCSTSYNTTVAVNTISVSPTNDGPACVGGTINLGSGEGGTAPGVTYAWSGPLGYNSTSASPVLSSLTTGMAGIYSVTASNTSSGCSATASTNVVVNTISVSPTNDGPACVGGTINLGSGEGGTAPGVTYAWSGPLGYNSTSASPALSSLTTGMAGVYTVTASNTSSGCSATASTNVVVNTISVSPTNDGPACVGGTINLGSGEGGTAPGVTYAWSGPLGYNSTSASPVLSSLTTGMAGTYTVTASNTSSGCSATASTNVVVNTISVSPNNDGPACVGGTINLGSGEGGTAPGVNYAWSGPLGYNSTSASPVLSSLTTGMAGIYTVTASNTSSGCSATASTNVVVNTISVSPANDGPACVGGTINLGSGEGGTAPGVTYAWSGPLGYNSTSASPVLSSLTTAMAGVYTVTASNTSSGCSATSSTNVVVNTISVSPTNNGPACAGGTINLGSGEGGTAPGVTYAWSGPLGYNSTSASPVLSSLTTGMAGTYTVTASNTSSGCSATASTNVVVNTISVSPTNNGPACVGGTINLGSGEGGTAPGVTYAWSGPLGYNSTSASPVLSSLTTGMAGIYTVTASNSSSGCSATASTNVVVNTISVSPTNDGPACVGGIINLGSGEGGTAPGVTYAWSGPLGYNSTSASPLLGSLTTGMAGAYTVTASNTSSGCSATASTNVVVNTISISPTNNGPACVGGTINLGSGEGGTAPGVTYAWSGPLGYNSTSASPVLSSLTTGMVGIYTVTASNTSSGCSATASTNVVVNTISVSPTNDGPACVGGTINLGSGEGGTAPGVIYAWSGPLGYNSTSASPVLSSLTTGMAGIYTVTASNTSSGCSATASTNVVVNTISVSPTNDGPACVGGNINLGSGEGGTAPGVTYAWSGPLGYNSTSASPVLSSLTTGMAGVYTVTASNTSSGCSATASTNVVVNTISVSPTNDGPACVGGTINLGSGEGGTAPGVTYAWSGPLGYNSTSASPVLSSLTTGMAGIYTVTASNTSSGCSATASTNVVVNTISVSPTNNGPACAGGTINLGSGEGGTAPGVTYAWSGPLSYNSTSASPVLSSLTTGMAGVYTVTASNTSSGCSATASTNVVVNTISVSPTNDGPACVGGTINLGSGEGGTAPGVTYAWSGPLGYNSTSASPVLSSLTTGMAGVYTVTASNTSSGCSAKSTTNVVVNTISVSPTNNGPACVGGTINLGSGEGGTAPGVTYAWSGPLGYNSTSASPVLSSLTTGMAGIYTVTASNTSSGCSATASTNVVVNTISVSPTNNGPACVGGTINLGSGEGGTAPGVTYAWSGPFGYNSTSASPVLSSLTTGMAGTYTVTASNTSSGCSATASTNVVVNTISVSPTNSSPACAGGSITLSSVETGTAPSVTFLWNGPLGYNSTSTNPVISSLTLGMTGVYTVTASNTSSGCSATGTTTVTVNPGPTVAPSNDAPACTGGTIHLLANGTSVGSPVYLWNGPSGFTSSSANPVLTAATLGMGGVYSTTITTAGSSCVGTGSTTVVVNPAPTLTGVSNNGPLCSGFTLDLSSGTAANVTGYSWIGPNSFSSSLSNPIISTPTVSATGNYTVTVNNASGSGCTASYTTSVTINRLPNAVTVSGGGTFCNSAVITAANGSDGTMYFQGTTPGGTSTAIPATSETVTVTGTYYFRARSASGCWGPDGNAAILIPAITGSTNVCIGLTVPFSCAGGAGTWSSSNTALATVGSTTGIVTGVGTGTAVITYKLTTGCIVRSSIYSSSVAPAITGPSRVCVGQTITLSEAIPGGTWTSSSPTEASAGATTGIITGLAGGFVPTITYTLGPSCKAYAPVTVSPLANITGPLSVCQGRTISLSDATTGGSWSSGSPSIATVNSSGVVTGLFSGTTTISYVLPTGCVATDIIPVGPESPVYGPNTVCQGQTISLGDLDPGGTWTSSAPTIATIGSTGIVTGIAGGLSATISYSFNSGCRATYVVTVNALAGILGPVGVCQGQTITLTNETPGGTWSSSATAIATIGSSGIVTGVASGTSMVSYILPSGCVATTTVTVSVINPITGSATVCQGRSITLADLTVGGVWSSGSPTIATVGSTGIVTGVAGNLSATISYTLGSGCRVTKIVSVSAVGAISGHANVCQGRTITLTDPTTGGTWTSGSTGIATVGASTGIVTGVAFGTVVISYTVPAGCVATTIINSGLADPIMGPNTVCVSQTITLTDSVSGGTWSSGAPTVMTVGSSTGIVTGIAGSLPATISYTFATGCRATYVVTTNPGALILSRFPSACVGQTLAMTDAVSGGVWNSASTAIATIDPVSGVATGVSAGTTTISYSLTSGCTITSSLLVNPLVGITGPATVCVGQSATLSDALAGGSWHSASPTIASIGSATGIVTGVASGVGSATISYTMGTGCNTTFSLSVNALAPITGPVSVCAAQSITLADAASGGTWNSGTPLIASVSATTGVVTGITGGTAIISYIMPTGCTATKTFPVNPFSLITAVTSNVCAGQTITLIDATPGGVWATSAPTVATVGSTGIVSGLAGGLHATISYTMASGCRDTIVVNVNADPTVAAITGPSAVSVSGVSITLADVTAGGVWASSNAGLATVGSTGIVKGVAVGNVRITYTVTNSSFCSAFATKTVAVGPAPLPHINNVIGSITICTGAEVTLNNQYAGGQWSSSDKTTASVNETTGFVSGITAGRATITYSTTGDSGPVLWLYSLIVNPLPDEVVIFANPGSSIVPGQHVSFTAAVSNGGTMPVYQWLVNGKAVEGATSFTFAGNGFSDGDLVTCTVGSGSGCGGYTISGKVTMSVGSLGITQASHSYFDVRILPNPNTGEFIIKGTSGSTADENVSVEVTNMLGQLVHKSSFKVQNGLINESIHLDNSLANGMYLLNLRTDSQNQLFNMVIEK